jgi:Na+/melibiose symporter-like transporter
VTFNLARVIGPLAGAFVVSRYGIAWAFTVNCVSFAALICALLLVTLNTGSYSAERPRLSDSIRAVAKDARLLALFGVIAAVSLSSDPVNTLTPAFATHVLHRPDTFAGYLIGAFGTGAVVAAFVVARRGEMRLRHMTATLVVMSAGMLGFAGARSLPFTVLALAAGGFGYLASQSAATSVVQLTVEENERGRMMALWSVSFLGVRPVGSVVDGVVASVGGLHWAALVMALPVIVATAALALVSRRLERPLRGDR